MTAPSPPPHPTNESAFKSRSGLQRIWRAAGYSWHGLRAAVRHEAAFRQELMLGIPMLVLAWVLAPGRFEALLLSLAVLMVWVVELLNSSIEAVADAVTLDAHPLVKRAKDIASAAVLIAMISAGLIWLVVLWPKG